MKIYKTLSKKTHVNKAGKEVRSILYYLENEKGQRIYIRPLFNDDYKVLDYVSEFVKDEK